MRTSAAFDIPRIFLTVTLKFVCREMTKPLSPHSSSVLPTALPVEPPSHLTSSALPYEACKDGECSPSSTDSPPVDREQGRVLAQGCSLCALAQAPTVAYGPTSNAKAQYLDPQGHTWFPNGQLNSCYNAVDRWVHAPAHASAVPVTVSPDTPHLALAPTAHRVAFHHVSPLSFQTQPSRSVTYHELLQQVQIVAGILRHKGVRKGDAVVIYMPMVPETSIAMLACARIGAVHSVVFGGFAPKELAKRIQDSGCKMVIAASCGLEPKGPVDYKPLVDEALKVSEHKPSSGLLFLRRHTIKGHTPAQCARDGGNGPAGLPEWDWEQECNLTADKVAGRSPCWNASPLRVKTPSIRSTPAELRVRPKVYVDSLVVTWCSCATRSSTCSV